MQKVGEQLRVSTMLYAILYSCDLDSAQHCVFSTDSIPAHPIGTSCVKEVFKQAWKHKDSKDEI